ncbi:isochorismatase hydrolase [Novosphingobium sp. Rr 2-17]|uniref:isochorismatase family protein n=1 Tax=Novosphingobium sp. Rr 2-17 TaxID=555793 RepID=UPI0002698C11|nr:isochorismatase family cysteine hydrolase [Novosphingobium sp. Rr 2-17]EIZ77607.1 isochorismatase hydrolase [Novosphingobium sp. Rr 2-17]
MHSIDLPAWMGERALYHFSTIIPATTALLVIDMQVVFTEPGQPAFGPYAAEIIPRINNLAAVVRAAGGMVAYTRHTTTREGPKAIAPWQWEDERVSAIEYAFQPGMREQGLNPRITLGPDDVVVDKYRYSALTHNSSDLNEILAARGIDTVIVTGVLTNCCCETTARDASMLGYKTFFLTDANGALTDEEHNAALMNLGGMFADVRSTADMIALIEKA